ncbi:MAG: hypothetical protein J7J42_03985 [Thermoplasmata archaeon]|nr:hypothetical protein [Thermoplasmata archaeon]
MRNLMYELTSSRSVMVILLIFSLLLPYISIQAHFISPVWEYENAVNMKLQQGKMVPNLELNKSMEEDLKKLEEIGINNTKVNEILRDGVVKSYALIYILVGIVSQLFFAVPLLYGHIYYEYAYGGRRYRAFIHRYILSFAVVFLLALPLNFVLAVYSYYILPGSSLGLEFLKFAALSIPVLLLSLNILSLISLSTGSGGASIIAGLGLMVLALWKGEFADILVIYTPYFWILLILSFAGLALMWRWKDA